MGLPLALSVHHFINSVGADAGFAAIIGLAILVLLYFAQARETSSLREQTYEWAQRVQQLEARIAQLTRQLQVNQQQAASAPAAARGAAQPVPGRVAAGVGALAGAGAVAAGRAAPAMAGAPAGVGAPALTAATKLIPTVVPSEELGAATALQAPDQPLDITTIEAPPPATVAGGSNGHSISPDPVIAAPPARAAGSPPPRIQIGATGGAAAASARRGAPPLRTQPGPPRSRGKRIVAGLLVIAAVAAVVVALLVLTKSNSTSSKSASGSTSTSSTTVAAKHKHKTKPTTQPAASNPALVEVAVLNGTATNQLAHKVALKLDSAGYKQGPVTTAADQTHTSTIVAYMPGHKADATKVATALNLGPAVVEPVDTATRAVVCPSGTACTATVVVTAGADLARVLQ